MRYKLKLYDNNKRFSKKSQKQQTALTILYRLSTARHANAEQEFARER